jgi:hypothetical protein
VNEFLNTLDTLYTLFLFFVLWFVTIFLVKNSTHEGERRSTLNAFLSVVWCIALLGYMMFVAPFAIPTPLLAWVCWVALEAFCARARNAA